MADTKHQPYTSKDIKTYSSLEAQQNRKTIWEAVNRNFVQERQEVKSLIKLVEAGSVGKSHRDAKQRNQTTKDLAREGIYEMLIIQNTKKLSSDAMTQKEQQRRESER